MNEILSIEASSQRNNKKKILNKKKTKEVIIKAVNGSHCQECIMLSLNRLDSWQHITF